MTRRHWHFTLVAMSCNWLQLRLREAMAACLAHLQVRRDLPPPHRRQQQQHVCYCNLVQIHPNHSGADPPQPLVSPTCIPQRRSADSIAASALIVQQSHSSLASYAPQGDQGRQPCSLATVLSTARSRPAGRPALRASGGASADVVGVDLNQIAIATILLKEVSSLKSSWILAARLFVTGIFSHKKVFLS